MPVVRSWRIQSRIWKDLLWSWEIKSLDKTGTKKELLERAVLKKKKDLGAKQKELAETIQSIRCNKEGTPSAVNNSMPCFVNLAWNSEDDMDNQNKSDYIEVSNGCGLCMSNSMTCCSMTIRGQLVPCGLIFANEIRLLDNLAASHCPPSTSAKCSRPPSNPNGREFSLSPAFMKSIKVKWSCAYHSGGVVLPLSRQKLCNLQRQQTIALIQMMGIFALSGILRMRHWLTRILKAHSMLILTCE